jgi:hypothetical protein
VEQQIGKKRDRFSIESRMDIRPGRERGHVTRRATNGSKYTLTFAGRIVHVHATDRRKKAHECLKIIDPPTTRRGVTDVLGIGNRIAPAHLWLCNSERDLLRKQIVGNAHFVPVGIGSERKQRRVL